MCLVLCVWYHVLLREDQLHQIAERIVREADKDGDGTVTLAEFEEATKELDVEGRMSFISFSWLGF